MPSVEEYKKMFIAKRSVIMLLLYIIYNRYWPESQGSQSTAAAGIPLICSH